MAHELTRSFEIDGKEHLFSSVDPNTGEEISNEEIIQRFKKKTIKPIGVFNSIEEMKAFAKKRSDEIKEDTDFEENF